MLSHRLRRFVSLRTGSFESFIASVGRMATCGGFGAGHGEVCVCLYIKIGFKLCVANYFIDISYVITVGVIPQN